MKTYIALVRHGVTDWNCDGRAQGHTDIPLNDEGRRQAEAAAARLVTERWDAIYSSPLSRARATAQAICRRTGHDLLLDDRLKERDIGQGEGTTESERQLRWPGVPWNSIPGLESNEHLAQRAVAVLTEIARRHPGQRVVVVAHGALIATFLRDVTAGTVPIGIPRNTGIQPILYDGERFTVNGPADHRHLLVNGIEYSGEKGRLAYEATRSGLPGLRLPVAEAEALVLNATAVESAWQGDRLVGFLRAFTDRVHVGYIDMLEHLPEFPQVREELLGRIARRFPGVAFRQINPESQAERSGA